MGMTTKALSILALTIATATVTTGCGDKGSSFDLLATADSFKQATATIDPKMDILWVIDNSGSMLPNQNNLTSNFNSFITQFSSSTTAFDFQMGVTTSDAYLSEAAFRNDPSFAKFRDGVAAYSSCPSCKVSGIFLMLPTTLNLTSVFVENASEGDQGSGDERAFSSMRDALASSQNTGFHRTDAFLSVIILSDEDDFSNPTRREYSWLYSGGITDHNYTQPGLDPISTYTDYLDGLTGSTSTQRNYIVSSISVQTTACQNQLLNAGSSSSIIGQRYNALVDAVNSGLPSYVQGIKGDICGNFGTQLSAIAGGILSLSTKFTLQRIPDPTTLVVIVNGTNVPMTTNNPANNGGFTYDANTNAVIFIGSAWIPPAGASIDVSYAPAAYGQ